MGREGLVLYKLGKSAEALTDMKFSFENRVMRLEPHRQASYRETLLINRREDDLTCYDLALRVMSIELFSPKDVIPPMAKNLATLDRAEFLGKWGAGQQPPTLPPPGKSLKRGKKPL